MKLEMLMSQVLRVGVMVSAGIIALGAVLWGVDGFAVPRGHAYSLGALARDLRLGDPLAVIMVGLTLLLLTPFIRVAASAVAFAMEHDWTYFLITGAVLCLLVLGLIIGKGGQ